MKYPKFWILSIIFSLSTVIAANSKYVSEIKFTGNSSLTETELKSVIQLQSSHFFVRSEFSPKKLNRDKISLKTYYKSKGFLEVEFTEVYEFEVEKYIKINFNIIEGNQYKLKTLELYGNKLFSDDQILKMLNVTINQYYNAA